MKQNKKNTRRCLVRTLLLVCAGWQLQSCSIENLTESLNNGTPEEYVILDKNKGTLQVRETYDAYVASFDIEDNPYDVKQIEFTADGKYHITFKSQEAYSAKTRSAETDEQPAMNLTVGGRRIRVYSNAARSSWVDIPATGTYTIENGRYVLMGYNWVMNGNVLEITEDDGTVRTYTATPATPSNIDALTMRLCHTWTLSRVLLKLYKEDNLLATYHLTEEDVRKYCVDTFVFTRYGYFYRYRQGENNGNGVWTWNNLSEQNLHYGFTYFSFNNPTPLYEQNDITVYFSDNRLYITEDNTAFDEEDWVEDTDGYVQYKVQYKARILMQLDVKGN